MNEKEMKELDIKSIGEIVKEFVDSTINGDKSAYDKAMIRIKRQYAPQPEQEALIRALFFTMSAYGEDAYSENVHLDTLCEGYASVIYWTIVEDYDIINRRVLGPVYSKDYNVRYCFPNFPIWQRPPKRSVSDVAEENRMAGSFTAIELVKGLQELTKKFKELVGNFE